MAPNPNPNPKTRTTRAASARGLLLCAVFGLSVACGGNPSKTPSSSGSGASTGGSGASTGGAGNTGGSAGSAGGSAGNGSSGAGNTGGSAGSAGGSAGNGSGGAGGTGGSAGNTGGGGSGGGVTGSATRPELTDEAAAAYTLERYLEKTGDVSAPTTDPWDPTAGLGDVSGFSPAFRVAPSGGTHASVQAAIDAAVSAGGSQRVYVSVAAGTYREVVCVPAQAPPITLYGLDADASKTVVVFDNYSGKAKATDAAANPCSPNLGSETYGTSGSATFAVYASGFQAKNLTIANDVDESAISGGTQAVALMTQGDRIVFENVRLLGNQDTFYAKTSSASTIQRVYVKDSYIEGDVDFVFGRATLVLDGCTLHHLSSRNGSLGYAIVPSTDARNPYGILVTNSRFTADSGTAAGQTYLGRAWDEGQGDVEKYRMNVATGVYPNGQAVIRDSELGAHIRAEAPWADAATTKRPFSAVDGDVPANRLFEYRNSGPGSAAR